MAPGCRLWLGFAVLCVLPGGEAALARHPESQPAVVVTIENLQFNPKELRVRSGTRITWVNRDLFPHTVTSTSQGFDSGTIAVNGSWTYVAGKTGEYAYECTFHPPMKGVLEVY
jgi:plastocyanin